MSTQERIDLAFSKLGIREPFIAAVMTKIPRIVCDKTPTACTNGNWIKFGEEFVAGLSDSELFGLALHEALHIVLMHMWRRGERDPQLWNYANDAIINSYILSRNYKLPSGGVHEHWVTEDMDSEYVYNKLKQDDDNQGGGDGDDGDNGRGAGGFDGQGDIEDAPDEATKADLEATILASAEMAKACGNGSGLIDTIIKTLGTPKVDWRNELRAMMTSSSQDDYTYRRPSRRFIAQGLYLPSLHSDGLGGIIVGIDTSASMTQDELNQIGAEITQIAGDLNPEFVQVVYCDTDVMGEQYFDRGDDINLVCKSGGGTRFKPVFDYASNYDKPVQGMIYFTDMYGNIGECPEPAYPMIWANTSGQQQDAPFGVVTNVEI